MNPAALIVKLVVPQPVRSRAAAFHLLRALLCLVCIATAARAQSFQGLGDLPGGYFYSNALGVSADGTVVVGKGFSASGSEAFRWTANGGMQGLGDLPGGGTQSGANATSADGSVVVGWSESGNGWEAFRWTAADGMLGLGDVPGGDFHSEAHGVSYNGAVIVGSGYRGHNTGREGFRWTESGGLEELGYLPGGFNGDAFDVSADGTTIVGDSGSSNGFEAFRWTAAEGLVSLGDLVGGAFSSAAQAVSADGATIVGLGQTESRQEAIRWTASGGMQALGWLSEFGYYANAVSGNGAVIVGVLTGASYEAFIWTAADGLRPLKTALETDYGLDLGGWQLTSAEGISANGKVIVGYGTNPQGDTEAWRAELPTISVLAPAAGDIVIAGEVFVTRWTRPESIALTDITLLPDTLGAAPVTLDIAVDADSLAWSPPDTMFSRSARIVVSAFGDPSVADTSGFFRIKPYHLVRVSADSTRYEPFDVALHGWSFCNCEAFLFHPDWWQQPQFDYAGGIDPFTFDEYDDDFPDPPINALPNVFPDWPAYTRAFGTDAAYMLIVPTVEAFYRYSFTAAWGAYHDGDAWAGSCSGMSVASLMAFCQRETFGATYPAIGPVAELSSVGISDGVREVINTLFCYWDGKLQKDYRQAFGLSTIQPRETLATLKARLLSDDRTNDGYLYLSYWSGVDSSGAHAVVPYRLERISFVPTRWRIDVYDPNHPGDVSRAVVVDSTANTWSYNGSFAGNPVWSGTTGLYVMDPVINYLQEATPLSNGPVATRNATPAQGGASLFVAASRGATVTLAALDGSGSVGYNGVGIFNTLDGAEPDVPPVGGVTPPRGFAVPAGAYALALAGFHDARVSATIFDHAPDGSLARVFSYGRADADPTQTDRLTFEPAALAGAGELMARSDDGASTKLVTLRAIMAGDPARERTVDVRSLALVGADSVRFAILDTPDGPNLHLANQGAAKTYTLRLREAAAAGQAVFSHADVPLPAGAIHTVRPVWQTLGHGSVAIDVDLDGDGIPEETIEVGDSPTGVPGPGTSPALPRYCALYPAFPNPFNPHTTLRFDLPAAGRVRLSVYDVRGRLVRELVDGERAAGVHFVSLDASGLASGVYLVRLSAPGGITATQRITLLR